MSGESIINISRDRDHLRELEELTRQLPSLSELVKASDNGFIEYKTDHGTIFGINLFSKGRVGVQRLFMSNSAELSIHQNNDEREWLIVYHGEVEVKYGEDSKVLKVGDSVYIDPGSPYSVKALTDSWLLAITVPRAKGYPHDKRYVD